ncbi:hypothetical protein FRC19_009624 [Serendipita sp. 401]|nr:hypothetical protein FRC19_009624 [Serendipita sp. 401]KAG8838357.1 hypothetical protein FRC18_004962 [Serendipita sp. 400]
MVTQTEAIRWGLEHGLSLAEIRRQSEHLPQTLLNLEASRYLSAAGMIVVLYDTILTLPDEIRLIWPMPFGVIKAIWFLSRYVVPALIVFSNYQFMESRGPLSDHLFVLTNCEGYVLALAWCINISFAASNWLLLLRVSALWGRKKLVIYPLYAGYVALYIALTVIVGIAGVTMAKNLAYNPIVKLCIFTERIPATLIHSQWLPILFDVVIFILTLVKAKQDNIALRKGSRTNAPVLFVLFRDGGIYCIVIIALRIFNFVAWAFLDETMVYLGLGFLWSIVTTLINRFYLNLRRVAYATAAALLTNASIRDRPLAPGVGGRLRELVEGEQYYARRGAQSPWVDYDEDQMPVIDVVRQGVVDEVMMVEVERQRAQNLDKSPIDRAERWYSSTPHPYPPVPHREEAPAQPSVVQGILVSQGVTVAY